MENLKCIEDKKNIKKLPIFIVSRAQNLVDDVVEGVKR